MSRRGGWYDRDDEPEEEAPEPDEGWPVLERLGRSVGAAVGAAWNLVLHFGIPAAMMLAISTAERLDVVGPLTDDLLQRRLGPLGLLLGVVAAVITTYSFTLLGRPFSLGKFLVTAIVIGGAIFPFLAASNRLTLGLTADQLAVLLAYAYLGLKVAVGVLVGATFSWVLVSHAVTSGAVRAR